MASSLLFIITLVAIPALGLAVLGWTESDSGESRIVNMLTASWLWVGIIVTLTTGVALVPDTASSGWLFLLLLVVIPTLSLAVAFAPYGIVNMYRQYKMTYNYPYYDNGKYVRTKWVHKRCAAKYGETMGYTHTMPVGMAVHGKCGYCESR